MDGEIVCRKRTGARKKIMAAFVIVAVVMLAAIVWLNAGMHKAMEALAISRVKSVAARAMNQAILESLGESSDGAAVIHVRETGERVYLIETDAYRMNTLAAQCVQTAQDHIAEIGELGVSIPVGTITGIPFLAGYGPKLKVIFTPAGSVQSAFDTEFTSSGINQTLYRVKLKLTASVQIVMPGIYQAVSVTSEAAIAESVIVGEVPEVYTDVAGLDDALNLIPTERP
ncbi:MAG TPA: sporulation protein YunB [Clostridia bacterium]|nr:sporulation protein YunB [Clostridia bacterium]